MRKYRHFRETGFSLIELMITVAIIAILTGITLPAYTSYIAKTQARSAQLDILGLGLQLESTYQRTLSYPSVNLTSATDIHLGFSGWSPSELSFTYALKSDASGYVISATGTVGSNKGCVTTMTNGNVRTSNCSDSSGGWL